MKQVDHLILGLGPSGMALKKWIESHEPQSSVVYTSRSNQDGILFDLDDSASWVHLPEARVTYWTFPPQSVDQIKPFVDTQKQKLGHLIVVGTTSSFALEGPNQVVDESTPLDKNNPRAQGEEYLQSQGAVLVMSSGQYGFGRNPLQWIEKGWVGRNDKFVNMIHLEDLAQFLYQAGQLGQAGQLFIASDNNLMTWNQVIDVWEAEGLIENTSKKESQRPSKKINSSRSLKELKVNLKFDNFAQGVSLIHQE